jgi:hypothetical protein
MPGLVFRPSHCPYAIRSTEYTIQCVCPSLLVFGIWYGVLQQHANMTDRDFPLKCVL